MLKRLWIVVVSALLVCSVAMPAVAQETTTPEDDPSAAEDQYAQGCETVATVGPASNDQSVPFQISGDEFVVSYEVTFDESSDGFRDFTIEIQDRFGLVESDSTDQSTTQTFTVPEGPGNFEVVTDVEPENGATYTIIIQDCVGNADQTPAPGEPGDDTGAGEDQIGGPGDDVGGPGDDTIIEDTIPDKNLPNTGGVPLIGVALLGLALIGAGASIVRQGFRNR